MAYGNPALAKGTYHDESLRRFLSNVFILMTLGLGVTGLVTFLISQNEGAMTALFELYEYTDEDGETSTIFTASTIWWILVAVELMIVVVLARFGLSSRIGLKLGATMFLVYAGLNGITLAPVIYAVTEADVARAFFIAAATFGACALFGHTTRINLLPLGSFFFMGLVGLLIGLVVNIFLVSPMMDFVVSSVGVLLFAGLTAYDMQKLRAVHDLKGGGTAGLVVYGALVLYLDFVNLFLFILSWLRGSSD